MAERTIKVHLMRSGRNISEIRRFPYSSTTTFSQLYEKIKVMFPELQNKMFSLQWQDDDGDFVSFSSNEELSEFTKNVDDGCLKIYAIVHTCTPFLEPNCKACAPKTPELGTEEFQQCVAIGVKLFLDYMASQGNTGQGVFERADRMETHDVTSKSTENDKESNVLDKDGECVDQTIGEGEKNPEPENQLEGNTEPENQLEGNTEPENQLEGNTETERETREPFESDPCNKIEEALQQMISMGFHNEGGWLLRLLQETDGHIGETHRGTQQQRQQRTAPGTYSGGCPSMWMINPLSAFPESNNPFQHVLQHLGQFFMDEEEDSRGERDSLGRHWMKTSGNLAESKHCFIKPEYAKDEREVTTRAENEDSKETVLEKSEQSDEDVDGPAAGTDSSKNDGNWAFVEDEILQTKAESNQEKGTETKCCPVHGPLKNENSLGFQLQDSPSDPEIADSLTQMMSMGFHNDGGWLQCLLRENHGNIDKVLDIIQTSAKENI